MQQSQDIDSVKLHIAALVERGRLQEARKLLAPALAKQPEDLELLNHLAHIEYLEDDHVEAEAAAKHILGIDPHHYHGRLILALSYEALRRNREAEEVLLGLLHDYPQDADCYVCYSRLMLKTLHLDKAEALAEEAIRLDPDGEFSQVAMALCRHVNGKIDPEVDLAKMIQRHPESVNTTLLLLAALIDAKRYRPALALAQQLVRAYPNDASLIEQVVELKLATHWLLIPLWPMLRFGWAGSLGMWLIAIFGLQLLKDKVSEQTFTIFVAVLVIYVIYSWVAPPLLRAWYKR